MAGKAPHPELILVFDGAGDRPRPPRRRDPGDRLLTFGPPPRLTVTIQHTTVNPLGQLAAIHRPQNRPDRGQRRRLTLTHTQTLTATTDNPGPASSRAHSCAVSLTAYPLQIWRP